jgi:hypothetical protein
MGAARQAKVEGMGRATTRLVGEMWKQMAYAAIVDTARRKLMFTSDDVFDALGRKDGLMPKIDLRAFGPIMLRAAKADVCVKAPVAALPSRRRSLHASPRTVWASMIFKPKASR